MHQELPFLCSLGTLMNFGTIAPVVLRLSITMGQHNKPIPLFHVVVRAPSAIEHTLVNR